MPYDNFLLSNYEDSNGYLKLTSKPENDLNCVIAWKGFKITKSEKTVVIYGIASEISNVAKFYPKDSGKSGIDKEFKFDKGLVKVEIDESHWMYPFFNYFAENLELLKDVARTRASKKDDNEDALKRLDLGVFQGVIKFDKNQIIEYGSEISEKIIQEEEEEEEGVSIENQKILRFFINTTFKQLTAPSETVLLPGVELSKTSKAGGFSGSNKSYKPKTYEILEEKFRFINDHLVDYPVSEDGLPCLVDIAVIMDGLPNEYKTIVTEMIMQILSS